MREFRIEKFDNKNYNDVYYHDKFNNTISHFHSKLNNYITKQYYDIDWNDFGIRLEIYNKSKKK